MNPADRAAQRCGRRAAQLLEADDTLLVVPADGHTLAITLAVAPAVVAVGLGDAALLGKLGVRLLDTADIPSVILIEALATYDDGSCLLPETAHDAFAHTRAPRYVLAPDGPHSTSPTGGTTSADTIAAIVTARGIYRPTMIARHHRDPDLPTDEIIPLG